MLLNGLLLFYIISFYISKTRATHWWHPDSVTKFCDDFLQPGVNVIISPLMCIGLMTHRPGKRIYFSQSTFINTPLYLYYPSLFIAFIIVLQKGLKITEKWYIPILIMSEILKYSLPGRTWLILDSFYFVYILNSCWYCSQLQSFFFCFLLHKSLASSTMCKMLKKIAMRCCY